MNPILMIVWGVLATAFLGLLVYRGQLTRYEDEQLFLNEDANQLAQEKQTAIVKKIQKVSPVVTALGGAAGLVTASVVGMYVWDAWQHIQ
jgi:hypothetical protein